MLNKNCSEFYIKRQTHLNVSKTLNYFEIFLHPEREPIGQGT